MNLVTELWAGVGGGLAVGGGRCSFRTLAAGAPGGAAEAAAPAPPRVAADAATFPAGAGAGVDAAGPAAAARVSAGCATPPDGCREAVHRLRDSTRGYRDGLRTFRDGARWFRDAFGRATAGRLLAVVAGIRADRTGHRLPAARARGRRLRRPVAAAHLVGVRHRLVDDGRALRGWSVARRLLGDLDDRRAEGQARAVAHRRPDAAQRRLAEQRSVAGAEVREREATVRPHLEHGVVAGHTRVVEREVVVLAAADRQAPGRQRDGVAVDGQRPHLPSAALCGASVTHWVPCMTHLVPCPYRACRGRPPAARAERCRAWYGSVASRWERRVGPRPALPGLVIGDRRGQRALGGRSRPATTC